MKEKNKKILSVFLLTAMLMFIALLCISFKDELYSVVKNPEGFREWVDNKGMYARIIYILMVIFQVIVAIIPGEPFELAAGYAFGAVEGTVLSLLAITLGSVLVFLLVRNFGMKLVKLFFNEEKINSLQFLKTSKKKLIIIFLIMLVPGTPKDLVCYYAGLTDMKLYEWLYISFFARIPSVLTSTLSGNLLGTQSYLGAVILMAATAVLCIGGMLIYYRITEKKENGNDN
ncbi:MAG: TVP38/TMEM64 family protein [Ruminococcaceae bacterium]|nr:TVP38/TMEM64 family protein [Oscillospiraceae bacterium]